MTRQHDIEPELTGPTPRGVRYRDGFKAGCGTWVGRLALMPHTLIGAFLLVMAIVTTGQYLRVLVFGVECDGVVVKKTATKGGKGGGSYTVEYTYAVDGVPHASRASVNHEAYEGLAEGDALAVRVLESDPENQHWVRVPGKSPPMEVLAPWGIALFWNGIMCVFLWPAFGRPWRHRRLIRIGQPASGVIRAVAQRSTKPRSWRVTYEYSVTDRFGLGAIAQTSSMVLEKSPTCAAGEPVTVLYDPEKPTRSVVYGLTDYRAE